LIEKIFWVMEVRERFFGKITGGVADVLVTEEGCVS
jgi:hypothetical protein